MALFYRILCSELIQCKNLSLHLRSCCTSSEKKGLVLGAFSKEDKNEVILTSAAEHYNRISKGKLREAIKLSVSH